MKRAFIFLLILLAFSVSAFAQSVLPAMNFQGRLAKPDGTPVPDTDAQTLTFRLYDADTGGNLLWEQVITPIAVHNGTFATKLDFSANYQNGNTQMSVFANPLFTPYLEIQVGADAPLAPRQVFASVAYALVAGTALAVPEASITDANIVSVDWSKITNVPAGMGGVWALNGNTGINPDTDFLGTVDNQPLIFKVNNQRGLRLDYALDIFYPMDGSYYEGVNILGGHSGNSITAGVVAGTIAGGGYYENYITGDFYGSNTVTDTGGTVGGGVFNTAGNNSGDVYDADYATVAGGYGNKASGYESAVAGGVSNVASGAYSFVAGADNAAGGLSATVPGGYASTAQGDYSFAAGLGATATHKGSFVWADSTNAYFNDSADNQFNIRAHGGIVVEAGADITLYTSATSGEKNRYLNLINSPQSPSASGLRAGGILCADSYGYANPGKNDMVVKGTLGINATSTGNYRLYINGSAYVSNNGVGLQGNSDNIGLYGTSTGATGYGVVGQSNGYIGVYGSSTGAAGYGVYGDSSNIGVYGNSSTGVGLRGNSGSGTAIYGLSSGANGSGAAGVYGTCAANVGVWGSSSSYYGVYGHSSTGTGVFGATDSSNRFAGYFLGNLGYSGQLLNQSDRRYKRNIVTFDNALDAILNLRGVRFDWRRDEFPQNHYSDRRQIGFIAQEVESVLPELVHTDENGYKSVAYVNIVPVLVEAMKQQQKQIDDLKAQVHSTDRLAAIEQENTAIKKQLAEIAAAMKKMQEERAAGK